MDVREIAVTAPLLTIVIPTKNRLEYVKASIRSSLEIASPDVELVIEDNSSTNDLEDWIRAEINDPRLVYSHSKAPLSMTENYDRAMHRVAGKYVCLIGDDDAVNPEIVDAVRWANARSIEALTPINRLNYIWPDLQLLAAGASQPGELRLAKWSCSTIFASTEEELRKCVRDAGQDFHMLPRCYYGIVRKDRWDEVRRQTGTYFPGISPDMSAALAIGNYIKSVCIVDYPLFIPGSSRKSNAGLSGLGRHIGRLRDQPHLPPNVEEAWSKIVPPFFSVETIWAEAAVEALQATRRFDLLKEFNVPKLYADLLMWHPAYSLLTLSYFYTALSQIDRNPIRGTWEFAQRFLYVSSLRAKSLASRFLPREKKDQPPVGLRGLGNIWEAAQALTNHLKSTGISFQNNIRNHAS